MNEPELMYSLNSESDLSHIEASDILGEDLVLDEHSHKITTRQKLHEHVEESVVLESSMQLDNPWAVRLCENITLRSDVRQLIFLELFVVSVL